MQALLLFALLQSWPVTGGAAPGYVPDQACAECHGDISASFAEKGMGQSFYSPSNRRAVETLGDLVFQHEASKDHYAVHERNGRLIQSRWRVDDQGRKYAHMEQRVDWVMGSGNKGRTYLFRTPSHELFQMPLIWYGDGVGWAMAPGYDMRDHDGYRRPILRACMFCHNAYPDVPKGSDDRFDPATYPEDLPQGVGCQRCHGPGAAHVELAEDPTSAEQDIAGAIFNPIDLEPGRRDEVCYQCHLQPTSAFDAILRGSGRGDYAFVPGEDLRQYMTHFDFDDGRPTGARFEINHHAYRLRQSECFLASPNGLSCLDCHDPHRAVSESRREEHFRRACTRCHGEGDCGLDVEAHESKRKTQIEARADEALIFPSARDCVGCHMPQRRTEDVIQSVVTDHRISREWDSEREWLRPLDEQSSMRVERLFEYFAGREGAEDPIRSALERAQVKSNFGGPNAHLELQAAMGVDPPKDPDSYWILGEALERAGKHAAAAAAFGQAFTLRPDFAQAQAKRGRNLAQSGSIKQGLADLRAAVALDSDDPVLHALLAETLQEARRLEPAAKHFLRATQLRPVAGDWLLSLARVQRELGQSEQAFESMERSLAVDPDVPAAWMDLARWHERDGRSELRLQALQQGLHSNPSNTDLLQALTELRLFGSDESSRDWTRGLALAERADSIVVSGGRATRNLALALALDGQIDVAREKLSLAVRRGAHPIGTSAIRAWIEWTGGAKARGQSLLSEVEARNPKRADLRLLLLFVRAQFEAR